MDTNELKAAIERVREYCTGYTATVPSVDLETVLALAEIGRLAVEERMAVTYNERVLSMNDRLCACDSFLAARKGGK